MNYYERHIGDYLKDTAHLSLLEHGVYGRLLDVYYTREVPIPVSQVDRLIGARSRDDRAALASVLDEFFVLDGDVYRHARCDREIARYQDKQRKAVASANARWNKDKAQNERSANAMRTHMRTHSGGNAPNHQTPDTIKSGPVEQKHDGLGGDGPVGPAHAGFELPVGPADAAACAMRAAGLGDVSATHPRLVALVAGGMTVAELTDAARAAVRGGKGFPWALARAEGQRRDAARVGALLTDAVVVVDQDSRSAIEADGVRFGIGKWEPLDRSGRSVQWPAYAARVKARRAAERSEAVA